MQPFDVIALLVTLTALFSYINHRHIRLHPTVGVMLIALLFSLALMILGKFGLGVRHMAAGILDHVEFGDVLLRWMLGFLLFAGAMGVDLGELSLRAGITAALAVLGTVASMFLIGAAAWVLFAALGLRTSMLNCLLLGALISPTDPIAVLALVRRTGAGKTLETIIAGESLFNDGVGVVLFFSLLQIAQHSGAVTAGSVVRMFVQQVFGGCGLGLLTGLIAYRLLTQIKDFSVSVLLTLSLVMGTYSLADALDVSGPLAVVVAGLLIGNRGRLLTMPSDTTADLTKFWDLLDEILNAVLFVLIGLQLLAMPYSMRYAIAAIAVIPVVLAARWLSVDGTLRLFGWPRGQGMAMQRILTWGGLRGGLAIAMALSLPPGAARNQIVAITYGVVAFSILVQGTTIRKLVQKTLPV